MIEAARPDIHKQVFGAGRPPHVVVLGAGFALQAMHALMCQRLVVALRVKEGFEGRHLDMVTCRR